MSLTIFKRSFKTNIEYYLAFKNRSIGIMDSWNTEFVIALMESIFFMLD